MTTKLPFSLVSVELCETGYRLGLIPFLPEIESPEPVKNSPEIAQRVEGFTIAVTEGMEKMGFVPPSKATLPNIIPASLYLPCTNEQFELLNYPVPGAVIAVELSLYEESK